MTIKSGGMHVATIKKATPGKNYQTTLVRCTYREGGKV